MTFLDNLQTLCREKGISPAKACSDCGLANSVYTKWTRRESVPNRSSMRKLAEYFGVSLESIAGDDYSAVSSFVETFEKLCGAKGVTYAKACNECDISKSAYTHWKNGATPSNKTLRKLADYFNVSVEVFFDANKTNSTNTKTNSTNTNVMNTPTPHIDKTSIDDGKRQQTTANDSRLDEYEKTLISLFREASVESRLEMIRQFMTVLDDDKTVTRSAQMTLPRVGLKASAGIGESLLDDDDTQDWTVEVNTETRKADFCVTIHGDSMKPTYRDGDVALVRQQPSVEVGEVGIFALNGEGYIKKLGRGELVSLNALYKNIPFGEDDEIRCFGKVVGILDEDWIAER